ncbi:MAG: carboxypeptidase M32, partial [Holophagales bacterium]|nr:carboxypeptidase M32 [Holophagales bacterium]
GATEAELVPLFDHLVAELVPLVREVVESGVTVDESPLQGHFPASRQEALARHAATALGFDFERGRLDLTVHPFCVGISSSDVRLTWRYQEDDLRPALYGVLHEAGHGLYEQGLPAEWHHQPVGDVVSLGLHESQSRLFENQVGRSRGFWTWLWPKFRQLFPEQAESTSVDAIWPALHTVKPSLVRVEADEGTYNLHVAIRFRLERALFSGDLDVEELPAAWDDLYEEILGIRAPSVRDGVLQDIHWSQAIFGYFPTYTRGNLNAAQLFAAAERDLGELEPAFARGEVAPLLAWMRERVHRWGSRYPAGELIQRATGRPRAADDLLAYLRAKTRAVYGVG